MSALGARLTDFSRASRAGQPGSAPKPDVLVRRFPKEASVVAKGLDPGL